MSNEKIIREALRKKYSTQGCIIDEFTCDALDTRNDLMLISNDIIISFEIKSDKDTLKRLRKQVLEYQTYSSLVVIAIDKKHLKKLAVDYIDLIDSNVIVEIYDNSRNELIEYIKGQPKDYPNLLNLLWGTELYLFTKKLKHRSKLSKNTLTLKKFINNVFKEEDIIKISKYLFHKRIIENPDRIKKKYIPDINDNEIQELILENQEKFTKYIEDMK